MSFYELLNFFMHEIITPESSNDQIRSRRLPHFRIKPNPWPGERLNILFLMYFIATTLQNENNPRPKDPKGSMTLREEAKSVNLI